MSNLIQTIGKPKLDYRLVSAYLIGTLEFSAKHNLPLSVEEINSALITAKSQFIVEEREVCCG